MEYLSKFKSLFAAILLLLQAFAFENSNAQLSQRESRILFEAQKLLEFPPSLQTWNNWTNFCSLPPSPSLTILCSNNHITELTIVGNKTSQKLSQKFSTESFFTILTKLSSLQNLSLVSLGLWGPLPPKINRFRSLEVLNMSSNFMSGEIPASISSYRSLKSLALSDNLFNGSVPDLSGLVLLEELDLSGNKLGPNFPSLAANLIRVSLANNSFRSEIPEGLRKTGSKLQSLDVSSNKLVGPIPSFLFSMPSIVSINLGGNQLSGAFAPNVKCGANLEFVDVSSNLLIGKLPDCLAANKTVAIVTWNCLSNTKSKYQRPYSFCQKDALAVMPPAVGARKVESTLKLGIVLGIIGGVVAALGLLGLLVVVISRKVKRKRGSEYKSDSFVFDKNPMPNSPLGGGRLVPQSMRMTTSLGLPPYNIYTLEEIEDATNNFDPSNLVRESSQGQLYKGWLRDGSVVQVKCLKLKQKHSSQALQQHMEVISKLRHRHLVSVLGHCIVTYQDHPNTSSTVFIVLENINNGPLSDHLIDWKKREILKWPQRMGITMGIARGIQYLHNGGILGNDLKIDNILLDESLTAKISCYNINLPSKVGAESPINGQGTPNHTISENPEKEDIYRLGVILIEVMIGRPVNSQSEVDDLKFQLERSLAESASRLRDLVDPSMRGTFAYESLKTFVQITINCLCKDSMGRPTIEDVLWHMQYSVQVQEGWTSSGNLSANLSGNLSNKF